MKRSALAALACVSVFALLSACSSDEKNPQTAPSSSISDSTDSTDTTEPNSESPSNDASSDDASNIATPILCASLELKPQATFTGQDFGGCLAAALLDTKSGRMDMTEGDLLGTAEFTYSPEYSVSVNGTNATGDMKLIYTPEGTWIDNGNGWIKGDTSSSDQEEMMAGLAGVMYREYSDPLHTADLVSDADDWTVQDGPVSRTLPNGTKVDSYEISNKEPFKWNDFEIKKFSFWVTSSWQPVASTVTMSMAGLDDVTNTQEFYDLGAAITIEPPA